MTLEVDYLVVGAGAAGMAFTDEILTHSDATVALVDRRHAPRRATLKFLPMPDPLSSACHHGRPARAPSESLARKNCSKNK